MRVGLDPPPQCMDLKSGKFAELSLSGNEIKGLFYYYYSAEFGVSV